MDLVVDSGGRHNPTSAAALAAAGVRCARRYHYNATRAEVDMLHANGVGFCLVAEFDTLTWHPPLHSPETGTEHASQAVGIARKLGLPEGALITFTADTFIGPGDFDKAYRYWALVAPIVRDAGYLVDAYGGSLLIDELHTRGLADTTWEAAARSWSTPDGVIAHYRPSETAQLRQLVRQAFYGGVQCDLNEMLKDPVGEWMPDGSVTFASLDDGDDMGFTRDQMKEDLAALAFDLADHIERARQSVIVADTQNAENVAGVVRGESGMTRDSILAGLTAARADGVLPADTDLEALAVKVAEHLAVTPKP